MDLLGTGVVGKHGEQRLRGGEAQQSVAGRAEQVVGEERDVIVLRRVDAGVPRAQQQVPGGVDVLATGLPRVEPRAGHREVLPKRVEVADQPFEQDRFDHR